MFEITDPVQGCTQVPGAAEVSKARLDYARLGQKPSARGDPMPAPVPTREATQNMTCENSNVGLLPDTKLLCTRCCSHHFFEM
jgi:hypothetical protein